MKLRRIRNSRDRLNSHDYKLFSQRVFIDYPYHIVKEYRELECGEQNEGSFKASVKRMIKAFRRDGIVELDSGEDGGCI